MATVEADEGTHLLTVPSLPFHPLHPRRYRILFVVCVSIVLCDFANSLSAAPNIAIYESAICQRVFNPVSRRSSSLSSTCKLPAVQSELALVCGWKDTFDQIPGVLLALPWGFAADRIGRRKVLVIALSGMLFEEVFIRLVASKPDSLSLRLIWIAPVFQILGGGPNVATSMAYAIVTDVFSTAERYVDTHLAAGVQLKNAGL